MSTAAVSTEPLRDNEPSRGLPRLDSVDLLRGLAMILMALDHVRYFFTDVKFQPEDMAHTTVPLFLTRWPAHFCAPIFFLLAGVGARMTVLRGRPIPEVSGFLLKGGLWLVVMELTIIGFAWSFTPGQALPASSGASAGRWFSCRTGSFARGLDLGDRSRHDRRSQSS